MMSIHTISLSGCTPEPLMNYLKALGVMRLVSEQADPQVRGRWTEGVFTIFSSFDADALVKFFVESYRPTPILSPWNGDGGFLSESGKSFNTIQQLEKTENDRLLPLKKVIKEIREIALLREFAAARERLSTLESKKKVGKITPDEAKELTQVKANVKSLKESIVFQIRSRFPDECLCWLDACMLVEPGGFSAAPLLGSGGVDGRFEFSANFLSNVLLVLNDPQREAWIRAALFGDENVRLVDTAIGQFAPGRIGGPNATHGMEGGSMINPWDFVLMIEGSVMFAGSVARKLNVVGGARAAFPFTVRAAAAGQSSLGEADSDAARGEIWLPLWHRFSSLGELCTLFSEGRAEVHGRQSRDGIEFARAVASLGVDRGIESFSRQGILRRNGLAYLATPLGRFSVRRRESVNLLREIDFWLGGFRGACGSAAPARLSSALRRVERAIFDYCHYGNPTHFQGILNALGAAERAIAEVPSFREKAKGLRPLSRLSQEWIEAANDGSPEFEMALALASVRDRSGKIGAIRTNIEPVTTHNGKTAWAEKSRSVVWTSADFSTNLAAVLARRVMDGQRAGAGARPLASLHHASVGVVATFLEGNLNEGRLSELLWGLLLCDSQDAPQIASGRSPRVDSGAFPLPRAYALLKLHFLDVPESIHTASPLAPLLFEKLRKLNAQSSLLALLRTGDVPAACRLAARSLRAVGLPSQLHPSPGCPSRDDEWADTACDRRAASRLMGALMIPIRQASALSFCEMVCRPLSQTNA